MLCQRVAGDRPDSAARPNAPGFDTYSLEAIPLDDDLEGELCAQEAHKLNSRSIVVDVLVDTEILQEVVRQSVGEVATIELQTNEHETQHAHETQVCDPDDLALGLLCPCCFEIPKVVSLQRLSSQYVE